MNYIEFSLIVENIEELSDLIENLRNDVYDLKRQFSLVDIAEVKKHILGRFKLLEGPMGVIKGKLAEYL